MREIFIAIINNKFLLIINKIIVRIKIFNVWTENITEIIIPHREIIIPHNKFIIPHN